MMIVLSSRKRMLLNKAGSLTYRLPLAAVKIRVER